MGEGLGDWPGRRLLVCDHDAITERDMLTDVGGPPIAEVDVSAAQEAGLLATRLAESYGGPFDDRRGLDGRENALGGSGRMGFPTATPQEKDCNVEGREPASIPSRWRPRP